MRGVLVQDQTALNISLDLLPGASLLLSLPAAVADGELHFCRRTPQRCRGSSSPHLGRTGHRVGAAAPLLSGGVPPHQKCMNLTKIISFAKIFLSYSALIGPRSGGIMWGRFKRRLQINCYPGNTNKMRLFSQKTEKKMATSLQRTLQLSFICLFLFSAKMLHPHRPGESQQNPQPVTTRCHMQKVSIDVYF